MLSWSAPWRRVLLLALLLWAAPKLACGQTTSAGAVVWVGMQQEELVELLGHPESMAWTEDRTLYFYPEGARFEFEHGILVSVQGYKGRIEFAPPVVPPAPAETAAVPVEPGEAQQLGESTQPGAAPLGEGGAGRGIPTLKNLKQKTFIPGEGRTVHYTEVVAPAMDTLEKLTQFLSLVYDPSFIDFSGRWYSPATVLLASMLRLILTMWAFRFASRRCGRDLNWQEYTYYGFVDLGLRLLVAGFEDWLVPGELPSLVSEALVGLFMILVFWRRVDRPGLWTAFRMVATAKAMMLMASLALLLLLLNLSVGS